MRGRSCARVSRSPTRIRNGFPKLVTCTPRRPVSTLMLAMQTTMQYSTTAHLNRRRQAPYAGSPSNASALSIASPQSAYWARPWGAHGSARPHGSGSSAPASPAPRQPHPRLRPAPRARSSTCHLSAQSSPRAGRSARPQPAQGQAPLHANPLHDAQEQLKTLRLRSVQRTRARVCSWT